MAQYSGIFTLSQASQAIKDNNWTGLPPQNVEYLIVAGGGSGGGGGGGGQGASANSGVGFASAGGSGIVIIRYPASQSPPTAFGGANTPQVNYADGYQIYTFTGSGTVTF